jgi:hypothetical protein
MRERRQFRPLASRTPVAILAAILRVSVQRSNAALDDALATAGEDVNREGLRIKAGNFCKRAVAIVV